MSKRLVAFLDILGFRKLVETQATSQLGRKFTELVGRTLRGVNRNREFPSEPTLFPEYSEGHAWCIMHAFSDSIVLISHDESEQASLSLLVSAFRVTQTLIGAKFPVRGGIALGEMYVDTQHSLFLGKALTRAYDLEQRQNWIGVAIDDSVPEEFPNLLVSDIPVAGLRTSLFPRFEVPMKTGPVRSMHTVNWRFNMFIPEGTKSRFEDGGDWAARSKIEAALDYALQMRNTGRAYPLDQRAIPVELRPIIISKGPPLEKRPAHGEEY